MGEPSFGTSQSEDRLDSWKEIAAYLKRDVTTVQGQTALRRMRRLRLDTVFCCAAEAA
jgi:hypothetical protein